MPFGHNDPMDFHHTRPADDILLLGLVPPHQEFYLERSLITIHITSKTPNPGVSVPSDHQLQGPISHDTQPPNHASNRDALTTTNFKAPYLTIDASNGVDLATIR